MSRTIEIIENTIEAPIWETHKRGHNWAAICTGKNAANVERDYLGYKKTRILIEEVKAGDVLTIAADYTTSTHKFVPTRRYCRVLSLTTEALVVEYYPTLAQAMRAAKEAEKLAQAA